MGNCQSIKPTKVLVQPPERITLTDTRFVLDKEVSLRFPLKLPQGNTSIRDFNGQEFFQINNDVKPSQNIQVVNDIYGFETASVKFVSTGLPAIGEVLSSGARQVMASITLDVLHSDRLILKIHFYDKINQKRIDIFYVKSKRNIDGNFYLGAHGKAGVPIAYYTSILDNASATPQYDCLVTVVPGVDISIIVFLMLSVCDLLLGFQMRLLTASPGSPFVQRHLLYAASIIGMQMYSVNAGVRPQHFHHQGFPGIGLALHHHIGHHQVGHHQVGHQFGHHGGHHQVGHHGGHHHGHH